jgi:uncharacterized protein YbjT (DUF2867 family)
MIVVTGATGAVNGATVDHLLRAPAKQIAVAVRDPAKAARFAARGVEVRRGDYADAGTLPAAFAGADQVLLVSSSDPRADAVSLHRAAIDAAVTAGVGRILYTSHQGAHPDTPFAPGRDHAATEQLLAEYGVAWTSLRNGCYAHSLGWLLGPWRSTGVIRVPADGPVSWTAREDAAEAAAGILASGGAYDGPTTLTARAAPTFAQIAQIAAELEGHPVQLVVMDADEWIAGQVAAGQPEAAARFTLGMYQAAAGGYFATVGPLLAELLGREPRTVREQLTQPPPTSGNLAPRHGGYSRHHSPLCHTCCQHWRHREPFPPDTAGGPPAGARQTMTGLSRSGVLLFDIGLVPKWHQSSPDDVVHIAFGYCDAESAIQLLLLRKANCWIRREGTAEPNVCRCPVSRLMATKR